MNRRRCALYLASAAALIAAAVVGVTSCGDPTKSPHFPFFQEPPRRFEGGYYPDNPSGGSLPGGPGGGAALKKACAKVVQCSEGQLSEAACIAAAKQYESQIKDAVAFLACIAALSCTDLLSATALLECIGQPPPKPDVGVTPKDAGTDIPGVIPKKDGGGADFLAFPDAS